MIVGTTDRVKGRGARSRRRGRQAIRQDFFSPYSIERRHRKKHANFSNLSGSGRPGEPFDYASFDFRRIAPYAQDRRGVTGYQTSSRSRYLSIR